MKICYFMKKPYLSRCFGRIERGLKSTAPEGTEFVDTPTEADLVFVPVISAMNHAEWPLNPEKTVLMQLVHRLAGGDDDFWKGVWGKCRLVTSYLDLPTEYLRMPLGYDPDVFYPASSKKTYQAITTGYVDENGGEALSVVHRAFRNIVHVGINLNLGAGYNHVAGLSDSQMAECYRESRFSVALRYTEGFELPLIEGGACGAWPVAFDLECYRHWFNDIALFVRPEHAEHDLKMLADTIVSPFTKDMSRFTWANVMKPMWERLTE